MWQISSWKEAIREFELWYTNGLPFESEVSSDQGFNELFSFLFSVFGIACPNISLDPLVRNHIEHRRGPAALGRIHRRKNSQVCLRRPDIRDKTLTYFEAHRNQHSPSRRSDTRTGAKARIFDSSYGTTSQSVARYACSGLNAQVVPCYVSCSRASFSRTSIIVASSPDTFHPAPGSTPAH